MITKLNNKEFVEELHKIYKKEKSLEKTVKIANERYEIDINRFKLSGAFHHFDLYVAPPNGKQIKYYGRMRDEFSSNHSRFAAEWLKLLIKDLKSEKYSIEYLTACYAMFSDLYKIMLVLLQEGEVRNTNILPRGVNKEEIEEGKEIYTLLINRWVYV